MTGITRQNIFKLKRSNVSGKVPTTSDLLIGELAVNTQDGFLYTSIANTGGTNTVEVRQIGWDRLSTISGGTVNGDVTINGDLITDSINTDGFIDTITVGENVTIGDLVFLSGDSKYYKASNISEIYSSTELRIVLSSVTSNAICDSLINGKFTTTGLTAGEQYWIGSGFGSYTSTEPSGDGTIVRYVGTALNSTTLEFNPDETYIELGDSQIGTNGTVSGVFTGGTVSGATIFTGGITGNTYTVNEVVVLTASTSQTINLLLSDTFNYTLYGNTLFTFNNNSNGKSWVVIVSSNPTISGYTTSFSASTTIKWPYSITPVQSVVVNKTDIYQFIQSNGVIYGNYSQQY